jgi:hypothetical protein
MTPTDTTGSAFSQISGSTVDIVAQDRTAGLLVFGQCRPFSPK